MCFPSLVPRTILYTVGMSDDKKFEIVEHGQKKTYSVLLDKAVVTQLKGLYPDMNLSATVRDCLLELLRSASQG